MAIYEKYVNKILTTVKPLTVENVTNFCKSELKKYYSERKLHMLEIVSDYIIKNYVNKPQTATESSEQLPF